MSLTFPTTISGLGSVEHRLYRTLLRRLLNKRKRNALRRAYMDGRNELHDIGYALPPIAADIDIVVGWPAKAVEALANRVVMAGLQSEDGMDLTEHIKTIVSSNDLLSMADSVHTDAMVYSCSFVAVHRDIVGDPDTGNLTYTAVLQEYTADVATGIWDKTKHRLDSALLFDVSDDYEQVIGIHLMMQHPRKAIINIVPDDEGWHVQDDYVNREDRIPCELFAFRPDERRPFGRSRIDRTVMSLTDSAVRTFVRSEVQAELYSVPPRYIIGASEQMFTDGTGKLIPRWQLMLDQMLILPHDPESSENVQVGQFTQYSFEPHSAQLRQTATMFASATSLPPDAMGVLTDNPSSAEAIDKAQKELCLLAEKCQRWFGTPWQHILARAQKETSGAMEIRVRPQWRNPATPSRAAAADAAVKLVQANILPADSEVTYDMLDLSGEQRKILRYERREKEAQAALDAMSMQMQTPTATNPDSNAGGGSELKASFDALGVAIRAGVDPHSAAQLLGLNDVQFTGAVPVSLRMPQEDADDLEDK